MKSIPKLKQIAQAVFNEYIRKRDAAGASHFKCISCGQVKEVKYMDAGHYYNVGHYDGLRYDEINAHGQCHYCNRFLHGNLIEYGYNLLAKIGPERFEALKNRAENYKRNGHKWSRSDVEEIIEKYKQKIKELE